MDIVDRIRRLRRPSLLVRAAFGLVVVALLPLGFASWQLVGMNAAAMRDQVESTHLLNARNASDAVAQFLDTRRSLARSLTLHPALRDPSGPAAADQVAESLLSWADLGVEAVGLFVGNGTLIQGGRLEGSGLDLAALLPASFDRDVATRGSGDDLLVLVRARVGDSDASVVLACRAEPLRRIVEPWELSSDVVLLGPTGTPIQGSIDDLAEIPEDVLRVARAGVADGVYSGSAEVLAAHASVAGYDWTVISLQPRAIAERVARRMRQRASLTLVVTLALAAFFLALTYREVVRPLRGLLTAQRRLAQIDDNGRGDLIGDLTASFAALEQRVRDGRELGEIFLGRYQVLDIVGRGGMGTVFRGWDPKLERPLALKTVRLGATSEDPERVRQRVSALLQEAVTIARFNHPNVVTIHDIEDAAGATFIAMEFVDGISLEQLLQQGTTAVDQVAPLGVAIARALAAAHARGVLHRDLKPANVLLGFDGSIKVADFGLSELMAAERVDPDSVFGTPGYIAPEVIDGANYSTASDAFALGVVLYECLTGQRPFRGPTIAKIIASTLSGQVRPPSEMTPGTPPALDVLVLKLLATDPEDRPSAASVAELLEQIALAGHSTWRPPQHAASTHRRARSRIPQGQFIPTSKVASAQLPGRGIEQPPSSRSGGVS